MLLSFQLLNQVNKLYWKHFHVRVLFETAQVTQFQEYYLQGYMQINSFFYACSPNHSQTSNLELVYIEVSNYGTYTGFENKCNVYQFGGTCFLKNSNWDMADLAGTPKPVQKTVY